MGGAQPLELGEIPFPGALESDRLEDDAGGLVVERRAAEPRDRCREGVGEAPTSGRDSRGCP